MQSLPYYFHLAFLFCCVCSIPLRDESRALTLVISHPTDTRSEAFHKRDLEEFTSSSVLIQADLGVEHVFGNIRASRKVPHAYLLTAELVYFFAFLP